MALRYPTGPSDVRSLMSRLMVAIAVVLLSACQLPGSVQGCSNVQIDWVDFIEVGTTQYIAGPGTPAALQESDLGPVIAHVKFKVAENVCDPGYELKDGDAAFLEPGTPIYQVTGHPSSQLLAARHDGRIVAYRVRAP